MPVTLANLKAHLNVTTDADDVLLTDKLAAAAEWIAKYTGIPANDAALPSPVKEATLQLSAHLYENREASLIGVTAQTLPFGMLDMLEPYREWVF